MLATMNQLVAEYVVNVGRERLDQAWILSPYDTWHKNPFYIGPEVLHPEYDNECNFFSDEP